MNLTIIIDTIIQSLSITELVLLIKDLKNTPGYLDRHEFVWFSKLTKITNDYKIYVKNLDFDRRTGRVIL